MIGTYARLARILPAKGKRRVSLHLTLAPRQRAADPDAFWKSTLDALVAAELLTDDNRQSVELGTVTFDRGPARRTVITLADLDADQEQAHARPDRRRAARPTATAARQV
jgi:hypothetical protein